LDISDQAIAWARSHYDSANLSYRIGDAANLPQLGADRFDVVVSMGTIEHVPDPDAFALGVKAVLRHSAGLWLVSALNGDMTSSDQMVPYHNQEFGVKEFEQFLRMHFPSVEIFGRCYSDVGFTKRQRVNAQHERVPMSVKQVVRKVFGVENAKRIARVFLGACFSSEDYVWSRQCNLQACAEVIAVARR
jgi:cyclopropane fatty-acyl-phospholipid synthase-like methyltransferase